MQTLSDFLGLLPDPKPDPMVDQAQHESAPAATVSIEERARTILESPEYFASVMRRINLGILPPAIEARFYDYAYGKPAERVEHTGKNGQPIETITRIERVIVPAPTFEESDDVPVTTH